MNGLAASYRLAGKWDDSIKMFEASLKGRRARLGPQHPETLQTTFELANVYVERGNPNKGIPLVREFIAETALISDRLPARLRDMIPKAKKLMNAAAELTGHP